MTTAATITVRPIRSPADYEATLDEIAALMSAEPGTPEADRLDVLTTLVEAYEVANYPMDPPDPMEAIRFRMEQQGLTPRDLEPFIGSRARVSEVLNRRRPLSLAMIRRLADGLRISAAVLIRPTGAPSERERTASARDASKRQGARHSSASADAKRRAR
jgi:HTH-type transcriptional regulator/antitoxin HigA